MTTKEVEERLYVLTRQLAVARRDLEQLLPHLSGEYRLDVARGVLRDVSVAAFNCRAILKQGSGPFAVSQGPRVGGAIYALTTIGPPDPDLRGRLRRRTVGFFWTLEQAEEFVAGAGDGLAEASWYRWAVVEEMAPGVSPARYDQWYWEYDRQAEQWEKAGGLPAALQAHMREQDFYRYDSTHPVWCDIG
jgi:hypothetical protein